VEGEAIAVIASAAFSMGALDMGVELGRRYW
jgi:hypothetical protein